MRVKIPKAIVPTKAFQLVKTMVIAMAAAVVAITTMALNAPPLLAQLISVALLAPAPIEVVRFPVTSSTAVIIPANRVLV